MLILSQRLVTIGNWWCSRFPNCPKWRGGRGCSCSATATAVCRMPLPSAWNTGLAGRWEAKAAGCGRRRTLPPGASHAARRGDGHRRASTEIIALYRVIDCGVWVANGEVDDYGEVG